MGTIPKSYWGLPSFYYSLIKLTPSINLLREILLVYLVALISSYSTEGMISRVTSCSRNSIVCSINVLPKMFTTRVLKYCFPDKYRIQRKLCQNNHLYVNGVRTKRIFCDFSATLTDSSRLFHGTENFQIISIPASGWFLSDGNIMDRFQISLLIISEFKPINFYSPSNYQKTIGLLIISREKEFNWFV